jgi:hypothetical protein
VTAQQVHQGGGERDVRRERADFGCGSTGLPLTRFNYCRMISVMLHTGLAGAGRRGVAVTFTLALVAFAWRRRALGRGTVTHMLIRGGLMRTVLAIATAFFSGLSVAWIFFGAAHYPMDRNPSDWFFWMWGGWTFLAAFCGVLWAMIRPGRPDPTKRR